MLFSENLSSHYFIYVLKDIKYTAISIKVITDNSTI